MSIPSIGYRAVVRYRLPDESRVISLGLGEYESAEERTAQVARCCHQLTHQPCAPHYVIVGVDYEEVCGRCHGVGTVRVRPKGWRKRTAPPWYMLREVACPQCGSETAEDPL